MQSWSTYCIVYISLSREDWPIAQSFYVYFISSLNNKNSRAADISFAQMGLGIPSETIQGFFLVFFALSNIVRNYKLNGVNVSFFLDILQQSNKLNGVWMEGSGLIAGNWRRKWLFFISEWNIAKIIYDDVCSPVYLNFTLCVTDFSLIVFGIGGVWVSICGIWYYILFF